MFIIKDPVGMKKIVRECYKQLYVNNSEKDSFLKKIHLLKVLLKGIRRSEGNLNKIEHLGINITKILRTF